MRIACEGPIASNMLNRYILVTPGENITANIHIKIPAARGLANTAHCRSKSNFCTSRLSNLLSRRT